MRRLCVVLVAAGVAVLGLVSTASAANRVEIESKQVGKNATTTVGVYIENDVNVLGIVMPLAVRSLSNGAYPSAITVAYNPSARLASAINDIQALNWYDEESGNCKSGNPGGFGPGGYFADYTIPFVVPSPDDPDGFYFSRQRIASPSLSPGTDFPIGTGQPSIIFTFTVPGDTGSFVIDTTCTDPAGHLYLVGIGVPAFTRGVVEITPCSCPDQGNLYVDNELNSQDLWALIEVLFFGGADRQTPGCPTLVSDFDGDGYATALDLNAMISYFYFNGNPPCEPCNPIQESCLP